MLPLKFFITLKRIQHIEETLENIVFTNFLAKLGFDHQYLNLYALSEDFFKEFKIWVN